ncbi:gamma-glutamylcyclotransferase [Pseudohoeflea suaedae]|uniref:Gamma-glutamylcyclotransferase n=1 Tax=Pseudohoeflea suaedae TaxID=877384 RepID=A0A4R5PL18_9HYPH|nr:gamma-glutamylcyclotransferase family protein [Pseudohoeflea suaedae]TDH36018.1 gamma-glutamylcyclotransferase [Pseudohoeflea suaedae]
MTDTETPTETLIGYFGYGSLVNRATLRTEIVDAYPARLSGYRRVWRPRPADAPKFGGIGPAVLTAERCEGAAIDGMLVIDRLENLPAVDERENLYRRNTITSADLVFAAASPKPDCPLFVYERDYEPEAGGAVSPILRSYLDAVMQGFLRVFGEEGLARFVRETESFDLPIHEDRDDPVYPRSVLLAEGEAELLARILGR